METNLEKITKDLRREILKMVFEAGSGHIGGCLSSLDLLVALYFGGVLKFDPKRPNWGNRDRFVLSNGHVCPAFYAVLAQAGFFSKARLKTLRALGSPLQGHPHRSSLPGVENSSGPLGQGLSIAVGMALSAKMDPSTSSGQAKWRVYSLTSDGEHDEGQTWEAVMSASKYKLDNLTVIVDKNGIQIDGTTDQIMPLGDLAAKYLSFGFNVLEIDGHKFSQILDGLAAAKNHQRQPTVIIAKTTIGKGISFMEGNYKWHDGAPTKTEFEKALKDLK